MALWFTADEHIGHANIIRYANRPFRDVDHMREELIERHNAVVQPGDSVWHLGDVALSEKHVAPYIARLHGNHMLIMGNHDACHPCRKGHQAAVRRYVDHGFKAVYERFTLLLTASPFFVAALACHMPYVLDDPRHEKYGQYRPKDEGAVLIHGHVHGHWQVNGRQFNVGVDVNDYAPISESALVGRIVRSLGDRRSDSHL